MSYWCTKCHEARDQGCFAKGCPGGNPVNRDDARLAAAEKMAEALKAIISDLADDDDFSARQIARHAGAESLAAWEQTK